MLNKFGIQIIHEVASKCEDRLFSSDKRAEQFDTVSKLLTQAIIELSRPEHPNPK